MTDNTTVLPDPTPEYPNAVLVQVEGLSRTYWWKDLPTAQKALTFQSRGARLSAEAAVKYWKALEERN